MNALKSMLRGEAQMHRRRASDILERIERWAPATDPFPCGSDPERPIAAIPSLSEPAGTLLIVPDAREERRDLENAPRLAGLRVIQARDQGEAIRILRERGSGIDLLLVRPGSTSPAALIRKSLEIHPGLQVILMVDSGHPEEIRAGYDAGAASILLRSISVERFTAFLKQSLSAAQEARRQELRRRERNERHASDAPVRRILRRIRSWVSAPGGSRRQAAWGAFLTGAAALLIGMGLAFAVERFNRSSDLYEARANRILEGMIPSRGSDPNEGAALLRWQAMQQIGLAREANEATRRYYQDHIQELRWQNHSGSIPPEPVAGRPPERPDGGPRK